MELSAPVCHSQVFPRPVLASHLCPVDSMPRPPTPPRSEPSAEPCDLLLQSQGRQPELPTHPETHPPPPPAQPTRSGTARVSFREPISCSYLVEDEEEEDEEEEEEEEEEEGQEGGPGQEVQEEEARGGFGRRLRFQRQPHRSGIPPQMDLLVDGPYQQRSHRRGGRLASDSPLHLGTERRFRQARSDRPRLDTLDWRGEREREPPTPPSLTLYPGLQKHEDCCSTCSSSSESEEEGYFLGQPIPLPPQLRRSQPGDKERDEGREGEREDGLRDSLRRRGRGRAQSFSGKDKDKNCVLS
ncbi:hypothetical protein AGOR_G00139430 [Albula goreensis]|uniref:Uncharacterized protein n=1 Tax=Albula goreensis TaxID=1534307 RepID=A0A8T3D5Y3_9TELE|nr:hypothetical protein AGOR_G00139430 [Albula goreensis]